jgi:predicted ATPase
MPTAMMDVMQRRVSSDRIVGRDDELRTARLVVDSLFAADPAHRVPLLLVAGEAGIGKSRLLDEVLAEARRRGADVVSGRCLEHGGEIRPLSAISEIVAELVPVAAERGVAIHPELAPLVDAGSDTGPTTLSRWPARLDGQLQALLRDVSARRPVAVAIEDLHWADETTRSLLLSLLKARGLDDVLLIGTYRSDELHRRHPLLRSLAEIERTVRCERIELEPLPEGAVDELARAITGDRPDEAAARHLARRSGGNPFYLEELLAAGGAGERLPEGVRHVVLARSQSLGAEALR